MGVDPSMGAVGSYALYRPTRGMPRGVGDDQTTTTSTDQAPVAVPVPVPVPVPVREPLIDTTLAVVLVGIDVLSTAGLAYHGYRRNHSIGWAIVWALLGGAFPIIGWPVALAQGFGTPRAMAQNPGRPGRRRRRRRARRSRR